METKFIIENKSKKKKSIGNFYQIIYPFYFVSKLWGFSTYTINKGPYKNLRIFLKNVAINVLCVTIHLVFIFWFAYVMRNENNIPKMIFIQRIGQQITAHFSFMNMTCIIMYWIRVRDKFADNINEIIEIDEMVGAFTKKCK